METNKTAEAWEILESQLGSHNHRALKEMQPGMYKGALDAMEEYAQLRVAEAVKEIKLPKLKIEKYKNELFGDYYVAELVGIKGMVVSADTEEKAIDEIMTSIKVQLLYGLNKNMK